MVLFVVFVTTIGFIFEKALGYGTAFLLFALLLAIASSVGSYFFSDKLVLATSRAQEIQKKDNPELFNVVQNLCIGDGLPMPKIYIMDEEAPNAFATGRDPKHAVVCVTAGILKRLNKAELEGVIAHELSHVKEYDIRLMSVVAILVGFIAILADLFMRNLFWRSWGGNDREDRNNGQGYFLIIGIVLAILSPIAATLIQLAISRKREFLADASGALLTRYPEGLASALEKIAKDPTPMRAATNATAHLFIENPFKGKDGKNWFSSLFDTHPPIEERIKILRSM